MTLRHNKRGFTLIEAMVLVVVMSIVAVGAGVGLGAVAKTPTQSDLSLVVNAAMVNVMEQMRGTAYANLSTKATALTNTSPGILCNGKYYSCTVTAAQANPDGTGNKTDFTLVTVTIGTQSMSTYVTQP